MERNNIWPHGRKCEKHCAKTITSQLMIQAVVLVENLVPL